MTKGKNTCRILKEIRRQIAEANDISYIVAECQFKGECSGSCPKCEAEIQYLEQQLNERRFSGKIVNLVGISASLIAMLTSPPAQAASSQFPYDKTTTAKELESDFVYGIVEQYPEFPGGEMELMEWVYSHLKYPEAALNDSIEGRVTIQFVVEKTGKVADVKVVRTQNAILNQAAIDVVKALPDFIPGKNQGVPADYTYILPVTFKLPKKDK